MTLAATFKRWLSDLARGGARPFVVRALAFAFLFGALGAHEAYAQLTVTPTTWNVIGLDSNRVTVGPDTFQVGARACNTGGGALSNVVAGFVWDSSNIYINLSGSSTVTASTLAAGSCVDFYFPVTVTRTTQAFDTARRYHITVSATGAAAVSTPTPRELFVKQILSQARNTITSITGPATVYMGQTYQYTLQASTATQGYEQLEAFLDLSNVIFQVVSVSTTYSAPAGATNDKFYADACGWQSNPTLANYLSCVGPVNYAGGKVGGTVTSVYTVKILSTGSTVASALILDLSGGSYHYNSDYGQRTLAINALPPPLTLGKTANPTQVTTGTTVSYTLRVTNTGASSYTLTDFVDTPPTSPAATTYVAGSSTFNGAAVANPILSGGKLTWAGSFVVPGGATRDLIYQMTVPNTAGTYTNSAVAHVSDIQIDTTQAAGDNAPATASVVRPPPDIGLVKSVSPSGSVLPGADLTYTISFTNAGGAPAQSFVISDQIPAATDFKLGSAAASLGTTGLSVSPVYSNDGGATYAYAPVSGGGGAPAGYDRAVTHVRWVFSGSLSQTPPNNAGSVSFTVRVR